MNHRPDPTKTIEQAQAEHKMSEGDPQPVRPSWLPSLGGEYTDDQIHRALTGCPIGSAPEMIIQSLMGESIDNAI